MKKRKEYMEKIYEQFSNDIKPTEEMKKIYDEFSEKIIDLKNKLTDEQSKELKDVVSEMISLEVKQGFFKGFSVAMNINMEVMK